MSENKEKLEDTKKVGRRSEKREKKKPNLKKILIVLISFILIVLIFLFIKGSAIGDKESIEGKNSYTSSKIQNNYDERIEFKNISFDVTKADNTKASSGSIAIRNATTEDISSDGFTLDVLDGNEIIASLNVYFEDLTRGQELEIPFVYLKDLENASSFVVKKIEQ